MDLISIKVSIQAQNQYLDYNTGTKIIFRLLNCSKFSRIKYTFLVLSFRCNADRTG